MKVKVLKKFKDKHTGEIRKVDDVLIVSKKRYEEILKAGNYVEECKDTPDGTPDGTPENTVEIVATDNVPEDAEIAEGVDVDADKVIIKDENGNVLDTITEDTTENTAE